MTRSKARRARLGGLLVLALGALALLAMPGVAAAKAKDRNHDHIPDKWEKRHKLSLKVNQAQRDQDRDQLNNLGEFEAGDNPHSADTNGNGIEDGEENAGTIASFDPASGKLTIDLFGDENITGLVGEETEIECGGSHASGEEGAVTSSDHEGEHGAPGEEPTGPSGQGDDENDDPPGHDGTPPGASEGPGHGSEHSSNCSAEDLVVGAVVKEAELQLENGVATFSKVELGTSEG
jgi:hypothetical protein